MRKFFLFITCFITFSANLEAQVGFLGKRVVVKTNALSGVQKPLRGLEIEFVVKRNLTISVGYSANSNSSNINFSDVVKLGDWLQYQQYMQFENLIQSYDYNTIQPGYLTSLNDGKIINSKKAFDINFRLYTNSYQSAPQGFYSQYGLSIGKQTISGGIYYPNDVIDFGYGTANVKYYSQDYEKYLKTENFTNFYFGYGFQQVFAKWVTIDFNLNGGIRFRGDANYANTSQFGNSNLRYIASKKARIATTGNLLGLESNLSSRIGFFISGYVKLGILIF
jgi:hypothetical protein